MHLKLQKKRVWKPETIRQCNDSANNASFNTSQPSQQHVTLFKFATFSFLRTNTYPAAIAGASLFKLNILFFEIFGLIHRSISSACSSACAYLGSTPHAVALRHAHPPWPQMTISTLNSLDPSPSLTRTTATALKRHRHIRRGRPRIHHDPDQQSYLLSPHSRRLLTTTFIPRDHKIASIALGKNLHFIVRGVVANLRRVL